MSLLSRRSRSLTRIAIGLAAVGVPLVGASAAQGAMGTSKTLASANINRPVLTSVTIGLPGLVSYCFATPGNQAVTSQGGYNPGQFWLGGYDDSWFQNPVSVEQESNQCVQASFDADAGQLEQYTYGGISNDAVFAIVSGNPIGNEEDGAPLNGSESHNGTRGLTTGPDLQTVARPGSNRMAFIFDQNIDESELLPMGPCPTTDFVFYDQSGELHGETFNGLGPPDSAPLIISASDNVVVVQYDATFGDAVADATIATVEPQGGSFCGALFSDTAGGGQDDEARRPVKLSVAVPGSSGTTDEINLVSAALVAGGESNQIAYTFDKGPVALGPDAPGCFTVNVSSADREFGDAATASGNVVTVTFSGGDGGLQLFSEMAVSASVEGDEGCVQSQTGQVPNTQGGKPVGGNVGAFGTGYVDGPDALSLSRSGGDMIVRVDQRVNPDEISPLCDVHLINSQGAQFGPCPSAASVAGNGSPTAPHVVTFSFDPVAAGSAAGLQILGGTMDTFEGDDDFDDETNVSQVFGLG